MKEAKCPLCGEKIKISVTPWKGQKLECPACEEVLEVVTLNPLSLDWPYDDSGYLDFDYGEEETEYNNYS
jgi:lysine biosynthesis protein LysW